MPIDTAQRSSTLSQGGNKAYRLQIHEIASFTVIMLLPALGHQASRASNLNVSDSYVVELHRHVVPCPVLLYTYN